tara:strand:- start:209 stop:769 length:561 start_codon:yes stop_codon:yes gene_type:complete
MSLTPKEIRDMHSLYESVHLNNEIESIYISEEQANDLLSEELSDHIKKFFIEKHIITQDESEQEILDEGVRKKAAELGMEILKKVGVQRLGQALNTPGIQGKLKGVIKPWMKKGATAVAGWELGKKVPWADVGGIAAGGLKGSFEGAIEGGIRGKNQSEKKGVLIQKKGKDYLEIQKNTKKDVTRN